MFSMKACVSCRNNTRKKAFVIVFAVLLVSMALMGAMYDSQRKSVTVKVYDDFSGVDMVKSTDTRKETVAEFLDEIFVAAGENDTVSAKLDDKLTDNMQIVIRRGKTFVLVSDGEIKTLSTTRKKVSDALAEVGAWVGPDDLVYPDSEQSISDGATVTIARISYDEVKQVVETPYSEVKVEDAALYTDESEVRQAGVAGEKEFSYKVTYRDGVEVNREVIGETVLREATDKIVAVGTKKRENTHQKGFTYKKKLTVTATAYDPYPAGGSGTGRTAIGMKAQYGVVAVDPKVIPLGTKLYIESTDDGQSWSYGYCIAADTGGAIKGNKIDLCYNTVGECIQFGRRSANVYVIE